MTAAPERSSIAAGELLVRKARIGDIHALLAVINGYAAQGVMLPRTEFEMSENIRDFTVVHSGNRLVGCGALHFYTPTTAEERSLSVDPHGKIHAFARILLAARQPQP